MPTGTTPLLLPVPLLEALDAVVHVKDMMMDLRAMKLQPKLISTGSRNVVIDVSRFSGGDAEFDQEEFGIKSQNGDVFIYLVEGAQMNMEYDESLMNETGFTAGEGPQLGDRGVRGTDRRGKQKESKAAMFKMVALALERQDARTWSVLKIDYNQVGTHGTRCFKNTAIFDPRGGTFPITKMSSKKFGWNNPQTLEKIDGYDLLTGAEEELLFHILETHDSYLTVVAFDCSIWSIMINMNPSVSWQVQRNNTGSQTLHLEVRICGHRLEKGRHFLIEPPATALSWVFKAILIQLFYETGVWSAFGAQCPSPRGSDPAEEEIDDYASFMQKGSRSSSSRDTSQNDEGGEALGQSDEQIALTLQFEEFE